MTTYYCDIFDLGGDWLMRISNHDFRWVYEAARSWVRLKADYSRIRFYRECGDSRDLIGGIDYVNEYNVLTMFRHGGVRQLFL